MVSVHYYVRHCQKKCVGLHSHSLGSDVITFGYFFTHQREHVKEMRFSLHIIKTCKVTDGLFIYLQILSHTPQGQHTTVAALLKTLQINASDTPPME